VGIFIPVYFFAIALTALTVGWAASLAKKSGQRPFLAFFYFVIVNDLVGLSDVLLHLFPVWVGSKSGGLGLLLSGFVVFPLLAAFSFFVVDFQLALVDVPFPKFLKRTYALFWGFLFLGFLAAEFMQIANKDARLANVLQPFFNVAIIASGLGSAFFVIRQSRLIQDPRRRRFCRTVSGYLLIAFLVFGALFYLPVRTDPIWRILVRSFLGLAYLLPLLAWLQGRFRETKSALLTRLAGDSETVDRWLETGNLSPRERQIARCVLEGKSNAAIEKELFIGRRTVESHLYSIYRKLGVKNRLQLARLAAAESEGRDRPRNR
jgi:DNA-binding CsgD family transcriptional regulator